MLHLLWTLTAWASPADEAIDALVQGDDNRALRVLRKATQDDPDGRIRCLLAEVALQADRAQEALDVIEALPTDAACAGRGAFIAAEAVRALGREDEAATRYAALTKGMMDPQVQPLARRLESWAQRILDEEGQPTWAATLLLPAATLETDPVRQLKLARRIATLEPSGAPRAFAIEQLSEAIRTQDEAEDRRLLARLLGSPWGLALLEPLPNDAATQATRVEVAPDLSARHVLAQRLLKDHAASDEAKAARLEVGLELANAGWTVEARDFLQPLDVEEALHALAMLAVRTGDTDARTRLEELLTRFPTSVYRAEAESELAALHLHNLRTTETFDAAAWDALAITPDLALEAAWAAPNPNDRLDELIARWPHAHEAHVALRHRALSEGLDWLLDHTSPLASSVRSELAEPEVGIRSQGSGVSEVELLVRGADELELRLHRIDLEGWLEAGGRPNSLGELDVAIVAPDRIWTVPVPGEGLERVFTLPIDVPGPGLYSVTAGTHDRQARTLLLVSSSTMLARAQGPDLALSAFHEGRPVPRARFLVRSGTTLTEVTADREGLARATVSTAGDAVVVAVTKHGPALLEVGRGFSAETQQIRTSVELDRPVYRPGDVVRFRALALRAADPVRGAWRVSLEEGSTIHEQVRIEADRSGVITGEVVIPWMNTGRHAGGAGEVSFRLQALPPGHDAPISLASVRVVDAVPLAHAITFLEEEGKVAARVVDGTGVPVADLPLHVGDSLLYTDDRGLVQLASPPPGVPWHTQVRIPGETERHSYSRSQPQVPPHRLSLADPRAAPNEPVAVSLRGSGPAVLRVVRLEDRPERAEPLTAPPAFGIPDLQVYERRNHTPVPNQLRTTVSERPIDLEDGDLELPGLPAGAYQLELVHPQGRWTRVGTTLEVREGARVRLDNQPTVGRVTKARVDGGWALLTAEVGRMVAARLVPPGASRTLEVDRRWHGQVSLVGTTEADQHIRRVEVDASLEVTLEAAIEDGRWKASGRVTDAAGNPMRAQVLVRAVDIALIEEAGSPASMSTSLMSSPVSWVSDSAASVGLSHGGWAVALAAELLAEVAREKQERRAQLAADGRLSESRVSELLSDEHVPLEQSFGGLGSRGSGAGGGGYGKGHGSLGRSGRGEKANVVGRSGLALRGIRAAGLWRTVQTDKDGRWTVDAPAPEGRATWRVDSVAIAPGSLGRATTTVTPSDTPWFAVVAPGVGEPGDVAELQVRLVNPGPAATAALSVAGVLHPHTLPAQGTAVHRVRLAAGEQVQIVLGDQSTTVDFPLRAPASVPGDLSLGLTPDPTVGWHTGRAAVAGRAALAVLPSLSGVERAEALVTLRAAVGAVRRNGSSLTPRYAAQALLLMAEATPVLGLPRSDVQSLVARLTVEPGSPQERLELAWATVVAQHDVPEATLGRLVRDRDRLDAAGQVLLARLLGRLERPVDWTVPASGPQPLPPLGHPERADWLMASLPILDGRQIPAQSPKVPGHDTAAVRSPGGLAGRPLPVPFSSRMRSAVRCGAESAPCRLELGDRLLVSNRRTDWIPAAGMRWSVDRRSLVAQTEGHFVLAGLGSPLHVHIGSDQAPSALGQGETLAWAALQQELGKSVTEVLASRPSLEDWQPRQRGQAARVRFAAARPEDAQGWAAAFEDLRDEVPSAALELEDVVTTAAAYHAIGRPTRAIQVYERVIGQLFLREAAVASEIEGAVGTLASIEALRTITARYPAVPLVQSAEFALPDRLLSMVGNIPEKASKKGVTDTELRLMAAAWDRESVALSPHSPHAPEAGLRLATGLLELGAQQRTLTWSERLQRRHPEHALLDRWLLLEALMRTDLGDARRAQAVLERLSTEELPLEGGRVGPSELRDDARFALGRLAESERRFDDATSFYRQVGGVFPQASLAETALTRVFLESEDVALVNPLWARSVLKLRAANLEEVSVRAYAVDLRTLFLRESGLPRPESVRIDGLRPDHTATVSMEAGPFPVKRVVDLPFEGPGAWLVRLDGAGQSVTVWVVRSNLEIDGVDANGMRRVVVRMAGLPTAEVPVRAVAGGGIAAEKTDIRGVALFGSGAPALAQLGPHYALTTDALPQVVLRHRSAGQAMPASPSLLERVQQREQNRQRKSRSRYDFIGDDVSESIEANAL